MADYPQGCGHADRNGECPMKESAQLAPAAPRHQVGTLQGTKLAPSEHQVATKKAPTELTRPILALSRITVYRTTGLPDGAVIREFWKIGCAPTRSARSALNDPKVARQMAMITMSRDEQSFKLCFYPHGDAPQIVENLPISQLPQAIDDLIAAGFQGTHSKAVTETLAISV